MPAASAAQHLEQRGIAQPAHGRADEEGERDEPDQAPERLAPDAPQDVEPAPLGGHLGDHAVVPQAPAEDAP